MGDPGVCPAGSLRPARGSPLFGRLRGMWRSGDLQPDPDGLAMAPLLQVTCALLDERALALHMPRNAQTLHATTSAIS
jgi:hypothetical protein